MQHVSLTKLQKPLLPEYLSEAFGSGEEGSLCVILMHKKSICLIFLKKLVFYIKTLARPVKKHAML